jgi:hypothetical protein
MAYSVLQVGFRLRYLFQLGLSSRLIVSFHANVNSSFSNTENLGWLMGLSSRIVGFLLVFKRKFFFSLI